MTDRLGGDLFQLHTRNGLVELVYTLFSHTFLKSVVQVQGDNSMDRSKVFGVELCLRTMEFQDIDDIDQRLKEFSAKGNIFSSYASHIIKVSLG